jgi:RHS repeat-associated protein
MAGCSLAMDASGRVVNDGARTLTWDAQGCLLSVAQTTPSASTTASCDATGRHVFRASTAGSTTRRALTVGALELRGAPENILVHRLPVGGTSVVEVVYKLTSSTRDSRSRIAFFDARGSEVATAPLSTSTANVAEAWDFDAWGRSTLLTSTAPRYGFVGFEPDVAFGTYAFGRRVYDPSLRRWLSPDPLAAADPEAVTIPELDLWGYAGANPVRNVDPAGTCISDTCFDRQAKSVEGMSTSEKAGLAGVMGGAALAGVIAPIFIEAVIGTVARLAMSPTTPQVILGVLEGEAGLATTTVGVAGGGALVDATQGAGGGRKEVLGLLTERVKQLAGFAEQGKLYILDENVASKGLAEGLRALGYNVRSTTEIFKKEGTKDPVIIKLADTIGAKVITNNVKDFGRPRTVAIPDTKARTPEQMAQFIERIGDGK